MSSITPLTKIIKQNQLGSKFLTYVTLIRQDVWEEITSCGELYQLEEAHRPIVVANGDRLERIDISSLTMKLLNSLTS